MRYGSARSKLFLRLFIGVAFVVAGLAFHLVVTFAVGLVVLAVAAYGWFGRGGGGGGRPW
ncbi:MAG TPA: hypothetical protein VIZ20_04740 [Streptosporangiaceae bacterium]|jgi:hypothetical protein